MCKHFNSSVARVYAIAAFEFAMETNEIKAWESMLTFAAVISSNKSIESLFSGVLSVKYTLYIFMKLCEKEINSIPFKNFIKIMAENKRLYLLNNVLLEFIKYKNKFFNIIEVKIISSHELTLNQTNKIIYFLEKKFNKKIKCIYQINNSIISGFIIKIDDVVINMSIKDRLQQLNNFFSIF
ncbi:F0F1 ATP synthase subunit delta [Buchnera aphidicola (Formosaphis micheliae)]|uniref:F0F1 ATP synthase subunit delta n=1 Tax=Buchnera aphidicola TaxID=9 RepID=UPI0031B86DBD